VERRWRLEPTGLLNRLRGRWQSKPHLSVSLQRLGSILKYLARVQIGMYRLSSALVPYGTHPDLPEFHGQLEDCAAQLAELGSYANQLGVRLSSHPGQYVVLDSASEKVSEAAARDVELQSWLFDAMGLGPDAVVVLHVGSGEGGREVGKIRFLRAFERLSERARARLVIENDDRVFALQHVLEISERTGMRVVWDVLHHHCNDPDGISDREALRLALATWPEEQTPKIHYSSPRTSIEQRVAKRGRQHGRSLVLPQLRAHADMVDPVAFEWFLRYRTRPTLRHHARGEGKGRSAAAPTRAALGARHPDAAMPSMHPERLRGVVLGVAVLGSAPRLVLTRRSRSLAVARRLRTRGSLPRELRHRRRRPGRPVPRLRGQREFTT
jgi:UV DNA damage endonuclease